jgi:hypothetical protein
MSQNFIPIYIKVLIKAILIFPCASLVKHYAIKIYGGVDIQYSSTFLDLDTRWR